jgi:GNAT superfamily N-acetyltransferase
MEIGDLRPDHIPALYALYTGATQRAGHCRLAPSEARFAQALLAPARANTVIFAAAEGGAARGFAALVPLKPADDGVRRATVSALFFADDAAGQRLLDACVRRAEQEGVEELHAFSATHFRSPVPGYNGGWNGLSDQLPAVARLLARNGFAPFYRELHLALDFARFPPASPASSPQVELVYGRTDWGGHRLVAQVEGQEAGDCEYNTLADLSDHPDAARCGYVWGLYVAEGARRRGIGRYMMGHVLANLREMGCDACWLTTGAANWAAQPLYLSLGFEVVDASTSYKMRLSV